MRFMPDGVSIAVLEPYSEILGLQHFQQCELIHKAWAMRVALDA